MVLGVFSTLLIPMDRVLDLHVFTERRGTSLQMKMQPDPDFIEIKGVFTNLRKRKEGKNEKVFYLRLFLRNFLVFLFFLLFLLLLAGAG
jgi:hypothetical protein